jgi:hypothetical protein
MSLKEIQLDEILVSTFQYLSCKDIHHVKLVSRNFNKLTNHYVYYSSFLSLDCLSNTLQRIGVSS